MVAITDNIKRFLEEDNSRVEELISKYPSTIPTAVVADFLGIAQTSVRSSIDNGAFGVGWRKPGKTNRSYCIPTANFVRWYIQYKV